MRQMVAAATMGVLSAARGEEESGMGSGWAGGLDKRAGVGHGRAGADVEPIWTDVLASTRANVVKM